MPLQPHLHLRIVPLAELAAEYRNLHRSQNRTLQRPHRNRQLHPKTRRVVGFNQVFEDLGSLLEHFDKPVTPELLYWSKVRGSARVFSTAT